jgi:5S rRNA maturation endonuclease (ribonuclease M5)
MIMISTDRLDDNIVPAEFQGTGAESETLAAEFSAEFDQSQLTIICNVASQFLAATKCKTAAIVTTAYYLRSLNEFMGPSIGDLRRITAYQYEYAVGAGHTPHEDFDGVAECVLNDYENEKNPWHQSIDAAILDAREWIHGSSVPPEIRYVLQKLRIRTKRHHVAICVAWALQQRNGDGWFIDSKGFADDLARHGIDCGVDGRSVREVLKLMRVRELTDMVEDYDFCQRCMTYRFMTPTHLDVPETWDLSRGAVQFTTPTEALTPFYSGLIPVPTAGPLSGIAVAAAVTGTHDDSSPVRDQSHSGGLATGQHIVADRHSNADRADAAAAAEGRWPETIEELTGRDLEKRTSAKSMTCPQCGKKKKATLYSDGGMICFCCGKIGSSGFDVLSAVMGWSYHQSVTAVARHFGVEGKRQSQRMTVSARKKHEFVKDDSNLDDIMGRVAAMKGISVEGMQHYGVVPTWREYSPHRNLLLKNAVVRFPMRRLDGTQTSYLDIGMACRKLRKGLMPDGKPDIQAYLPNDYDADDRKPVVLTEGPKDAIRGWELTDGVHVIGLQCGHLPKELVKNMRGRRVLIFADADKAGRENARRWEQLLQSYGVDVRVIDMDPGRTDGAGIREHAEADEDSVRRLLASHGAGTVDGWTRDVVPAAEGEVDIEWAAVQFM